MKRTIVSVAAVGCAAALFWGLSAKHEPVAPTPSSAVAPSYAPLLADVWTIGETRDYRVGFSSELRGTIDQKPTDVTLAGALTLRLVAVRKQPGATTLAATISAQSLKRRVDGAEESQVDAANRALAKPFAVTLGDHGEITAAGVAAEDRVLQTMARSVLSALQVVRARDARAPSWEATESDASGRLVARYERSGELALQKRATRYLETQGQGLGMNYERSLAAELTLRSSGALQHARVTRREQLTGAESTLRGATRIELELRAIGRSAAPRLALSASPPADLAAQPDMEAERKRFFEEVARGHSVPELVGVLRELKPDDGQAQSQTMTRLEAVIRTQGRPAVDAALQAARAAETPELARAVTGALASAATPEAQRGLRELAQDSALRKDMRDNALMSLGMVEKPTAESIDLLKTTAIDPAAEPELRETATLAAGAALRQVDPDDSQAAESANAALAQLTRDLSSETSSARRGLIVSALGNSGDARTLGPLGEALKSSDVYVRANSAYGLRHVQDARADGWLAEAVLNDEDPAVRQDALRAVAYRALTPETRSALVDALEHDDESRVRRLAAEVAGPYASSDEAVRESLQRSLANDGDENVRAQVQQALAPAATQ